MACLNILLGHMSTLLAHIQPAIPATPGLFLLGNFPATLPKAYMTAWGCDLGEGPGT